MNDWFLVYEDHLVKPVNTYPHEGNEWMEGIIHRQPAMKGMKERFAADCSS